MSDLSESNVQLRSDVNNDLVVSSLVTLEDDEVTIDESQFDMGKGLQQ